METVPQQLGVHMPAFSHFRSGLKHIHLVADQTARIVTFVMRKNLVEKGEVQSELWR
jgi:hypothetical protein